MRNYILALILTIFSAKTMAQNDLDSISDFDVDPYTREVQIAQWAAKVKADPDFQDNYNKLHQFSQKREKTLSALTLQKRQLQNALQNSESLKLSFKRKINEIDRKLSAAKNGVVSLTLSEYYRWNYSFNYYDGGGYGMPQSALPNTGNTITIDTALLIEWKQSYSLAIDKMEENRKSLINLSENINNVQSDLDDCENQITNILSLKIKEDAQRKEISLYFTGLIAIVLGSFFITLYKRGNANLAELLLSTKGLQFITVFIIIIAVVLFGILDIVKGEQLATILSGVAGYILGNGGAVSGFSNGYPGAMNNSDATKQTGK